MMDYLCGINYLNWMQDALLVPKQVSAKSWTGSRNRFALKLICQWMISAIRPTSNKNCFWGPCGSGKRRREAQKGLTKQVLIKVCRKSKKLWLTRKRGASLPEKRRIRSWCGTDVRVNGKYNFTFWDVYECWKAEHSWETTNIYLLDRRKFGGCSRRNAGTKFENVQQKCNTGKNAQIKMRIKVLKNNKQAKKLWVSWLVLWS